MDPTDINALVMALSGRNAAPPPPSGQQPPGPQGPMDMRTQGLINVLMGDHRGQGVGEALIGNANQQQQFQSQAPLRAAQAQHAQGQADELRQRMRNEAPQAALDGQTPSVYEALTKRANVPKFSVNPATGGIFDARTGQAPGGGKTGGGSGLSGDALDQLAEQFHATGALPPVGRGSNAALTIKTIVNRAAELHPDGNLAGNKAGFKADSASLAKAQTAADSMEAFENTALKNLDNFRQVAGSVVDVGSPLFNRPLREVSSKLAGSPKQAQFNAARQVAVQEIGKVLGGAVIGGAISDSQRHEVEGLLSPDATLAQIEAVSQTLRQDMANRKAAVNGQIATIRQRLGGGTAQPAAGPQAPAPVKATHRFNPASGKIEAIP